MSDIFAIVRFGDFSEYRDAIESVDINVVDENGSNLLGPAIAYNRSEITRDLLARGIDINHRGERGMTPLQLAIQWKNIELARQLVNLGSDLNFRDIYGNNALWYAIGNPQIDYDFVKLMLEKGADPYRKNNIGRSSVDSAEQIGDDKLIEMLSSVVSDQKSET